MIWRMVSPATIHRLRPPQRRKSNNAVSDWLRRDQASGRRLGIMESKIIAFLFGLVYCNSRKTN